MDNPVQIEQTPSGVMIRKDLVVYARTIKNYDQCGNDCFVVKFAGEKEPLRLTEEDEIAEMKVLLGYK
jgi:hypothetical protein